MFFDVMISGISYMIVQQQKQGKESVLIVQKQKWLVFDATKIDRWQFRKIPVSSRETKKSTDDRNDYLKLLFKLHQQAIWDKTQDKTCLRLDYTYVSSRSHDLP